MIHYDLRCGDGHTFDGWFRSSAAFDQQAASGLLDCPVCASTSITRALMAPRLNRGLAAPASEMPAAASEAPAAPEPGTAVAIPSSPAMTVGGAPVMPDQVRAVLQRVRAEIEQKCDYVGTKFADEARAMHRGEQPRRSIYGETSPDQAEALAEEGIDVARIPWVPRADG
jgi:hypothetical protein